MQIMRIQASKVGDVRDSSFWNEPDENVTEIILGAPISPRSKGSEEKKRDTNSNASQNVL